MRGDPVGPHPLLEGITQGEKAGLAEGPAEERKAYRQSSAREPGGHDQIGEPAHVGEAYGRGSVEIRRTIDQGGPRR